MTIPYYPKSQTVTNSSLFTLKVYHRANLTYMRMHCLTPIYYTGEIKNLHSVLASSIPSIYSCKCFNENKSSFAQEVKDTEIGHLFEHILLEYICHAKIKSGSEDAEFRGVTKWNWEEDLPGVFHIYINSSFKDIYSFKDAFNKSVLLLNRILE